ncbi:TonB-dependent receptor [Pelomonas sp. SE-A7]|uniref:TonB-dependent receptor plug domain-containing protein n=1 Tax=Pelomonas sp. SE-A7 TaxID=3054953 RepID=UPI00259CF12D|nr:TonB-dependent receptor [Pelomonas sp. SE-A7]MDM4767937.1 TonB-dependent receptor [Pelomonas sp. SE-A7]
MKNVWLALCGGNLLLPLALAGPVPEEDIALAFGDKHMVSIATGSRQSLKRAPAVATVITAQDIAAMGATDLDQALASVPGLHVSYGPILNVPLYGIRGMLSQPLNVQVLVLLNGQPMKTAYAGDKGNEWGGFPLENVARIEVIRGPGSALYGADAFAGVINIVTKGPAALKGTELGARVGAFKAGDLWLQHAGSLGPAALSAYLRVGKTDGHGKTIEADAATRLDNLFGTHASRAPGPINAGHDALDAGLELGWEKWRLRANKFMRHNLGTGAGVNSALDPDSHIDMDRLMADLSWTDAQFAQDWVAGATVAMSRYQFVTPRGLTLFPAGTRIGANLFPNGMIGGPARWERVWRFDTHAIYSGLAGHSLRIGLGHDDTDLYRAETRKNFIVSPTGVPVPTGPVIDYNPIQPHILPARRTSNYLYAQDEWSLAPDWSLTAGLRHDRYSDFGGTTNPRLALVWEAAYNVTAKLMHGRAFRAPGFSEQFTINPVSTGNPDIKPERMKTSELALAWAPVAELQLNLSLYRLDASEIIRVVANPPPATGATYRNVGRLRGRGGELEMQWDALRQLRVSGHLAFQRTTDRATGLDAGYAPHQHHYARVDWRASGEWQLGTQLNRVADRKRASGDARAPVPDYTTVDLSLRRTMAGSGWEIAALLRNAFDADAREPTLPGGTLPNDLPLAGRSWSVEARLRF